jgi:ABC-2 type transport system ATP-binding protein
VLDADEGFAEVAGIDVRKDPNGVRSRIGLSGQFAAVDEYLTGYENLEMVGQQAVARPRPRAAEDVQPRRVR